MNSELVKRKFKHLGLWLVLVVVVLLLTLLFNFFGTLSSAALTGMMLGAIKHKRWLTLPVSAVFPGVVFGLMYFSEVELEGQKRIVVPALCFGAFWVIYFLTCVMMGYERRESDSHPQVAATPAKSIAKLHLDQLQGTWSCESDEVNSQIKKRLIEIRGRQLTLTEFDSDGQKRLQVEGDVRLEESGSSRVLVVSSRPRQSSNDAG